MGLLDQISAADVHDTADGRRIFCHGLVGRRCVFVNAAEERRLRRVYGMGFVVTAIAAVLPAALAPFWLRGLVILPLGVILTDCLLRRMTARLAPASRPGFPSFENANRKMATESGRGLLWCQLAFFVAMIAVIVSGIVPDEALGWRKYAGLAIGAAMIVQVIYQLVLLNRRATPPSPAARREPLDETPSSARAAATD